MFELKNVIVWLFTK